MLGIELEQTRVYQEAFAEGEAKGEARVYQEAFAEGEAKGEARGEQALVLRLLNRRVGNISSEVEAKIRALPLNRLEELLDAALDFVQISDLNNWLK